MIATSALIMVASVTFLCPSTFAASPDESLIAGALGENLNPNVAILVLRNPTKNPHLVLLRTDNEGKLVRINGKINEERILGDVVRLGKNTPTFFAVDQVNTVLYTVKVSAEEKAIVESVPDELNKWVKSQFEQALKGVTGGTPQTATNANPQLIQYNLAKQDFQNAITALGDIADTVSKADKQVAAILLSTESTEMATASDDEVTRRYLSLKPQSTTAIRSAILSVLDNVPIDPAPANDPSNINTLRRFAGLTSGPEYDLVKQKDWFLALQKLSKEHPATQESTKDVTPDDIRVLGTAAIQIVQVRYQAVESAGKALKAVSSEETKKLVDAENELYKIALSTLPASLDDKDKPVASAFRATAARYEAVRGAKWVKFDTKTRTLQNAIEYTYETVAAAGYDAAKLNPGKETVRAEIKEGYRFRFSAGPVLSGLTNRSYTVKDGTIQRRGSENDAAYSTGFFTHIVEGAFSPTVVIAIDQDQKTQIGLGISYIIEGVAQQRLVLTGGGIYGRTNRLSGYEEGDSFTGTTVPTASVGKFSWFGGISYRF